MALAIANRYARALADVLGRPDSPVPPERALEQIESFRELLIESAELKNALLSPAVDTAKKRALVRILGERIGLSEPVRNFFYIVINHKRVGLLDDIIASFRSWLDDRGGIARLDVTSAQALDDGLQRSLVDRFSGVTGRTVRAKFHEDPELLGGAVVRHGSTVYDGSLRAQLNALDHALAGDR
jgi:F-type H+-transporting ATPase subunit delta